MRTVLVEATAFVNALANLTMRIGRVLALAGLLHGSVPPQGLPPQAPAVTSHGPSFGGPLSAVCVEVVPAPPRPSGASTGMARVRQENVLGTSKSSYT